MKRTLLFLFCALISTQMFSETLFGYLFPTLAYLERTSCHYMEGNEQNRTLNRLSFEDNMFEIDGNYYIEYNGFWLREDKEGRILVYSEPAKKDLVLYDFTLEIGDTLTTLNIDQVPMTEGDPILPGLKPVVVDYPIYINGELSSPIDTLIVTDVSMVMMCDSNQYRKWTFSNGMEYMVNIGHLGADFFPIIRNPWEELPACCVEEHLVCASSYDRLIYLMDDEERNRLNIDCPCTSWSKKWQWRSNTWNVLEYKDMALEQTAQTWQYELAHDTIIGGKEYIAVTRHWTAYDESAAEYVAAVRFAENKKAFIYYDNAEYLLYDFGYHEIGDTLEVFSGINNYMHFKTYKCVITDNYSTAGGIAEDTYVMDIIHPITGDTIPSALVWQEFVGSYSGFLHGGLLVPGNSNYQLLCAYKDNVLAYSVDNDAFTDNDTFIEYGCEYNAEQKPKDLFPTLWGLRRTHTIEMYDYAPNDGKRSGGYPLSFAPVKDTIINGKTYLQFSDNLHELGYSLFFLREENNKVLIYSSILQDDLVLYDYTLEVGDSLYTIEGYDWFDDVNITKLKKTKDAYVVTDVSTITLSDGIERKKWSLYKGYTPLEYVEGIGCFGENLSWPGDFFRLITNYPYIAESVGDHLVCVSKNGQLLYSMTKDEMNSFTWTCECLSEKDTTYYKSKWCDTWNMLVRTGSIYPPSSTPYRYQLAKDTVIGEHTYTAVVQKEINDALDAPHYVAAVRFTDDRKVYIYYDNAEYLLYDFNVQEGDELEVFAGINNYTSEIKTYKCTVTGVEQYACVGCPAAITLEVHNHPNDFREFYRETQWIEGVGDINGFLNGINHYVEMDGGGSEYLLCAHKGDELKYTGPLYEEYGCEYNAGPFNEKLLGTWRVVGGNEIISISDSIIVFIGLTQKYTASATQLTVERLWIPEEESYRWANCNYTLSNDTLWIDNFMPLLVATYPPTFGPITLVKVKHEDLFPTLWGLQRTTFYHYTECSDSYSSLTASNEIVTINDKPYLRFGKLFLREANNQVLIYSAAYDKDLVLYDWNLEVGDSISLLAMDYGVYPEYAVSVVDYRVIVDIDENGDLIMDTIPTDKVVVDRISTITLLDGKEYKTWHLATGWAGGITYVEGIGILSERYGGGDYFGLIRPEELPTCYYGDLLVCVSKNNKLLYQMDPVKMDELGAECLCDYDRGPRKDNAKNGKIGGRPTPTQWNMLEVETKEMDGTPTILRAETFSYTLENDSIVANNKTFYQLARQSTKDTAITKSFVGALHFGEDEDNRVYFLRDGVEYVLYDFTAEPGDTIEIFAGINNYPQYTTYTHMVVDKDTTEDGVCRMFLEVVFLDETTTATNAEKVWLAGLGSIDGIVHNAAQRTSDAHAAPARSAHSSDTQTSVMLCAWREDSCLYTTNHPEYDTFGCVYNQDPTAIENLTSPSSYQKIIHEGTLLILHEGKVYNVIGIQIK